MLHPKLTEDPMTDDRMALAELLQKSGDGDFLRSVAEAVLQILMEADVEGLIGAGSTSAPAIGSITATAIASAASTRVPARSSCARRSCKPALTRRTRPGGRSPTSCDRVGHKLAVSMDDSEHDVLAYMAFPAQHRTKLHSTNPLERLNKEVKRRARRGGIFPHYGRPTPPIRAPL